MADPESRVRRTTRFYLRKVNRAVSRYNLIEQGDRIAVAVSGGKDSLSLLRLLRDRPRFSPPPYEIIAIHVRYVGWEVGAPPRDVLEAHFQREQAPYVFETVDLTGEEVGCFRCSWQRRKALFTTAYRLGCNKVALAHHQEDIVETILMNLLFHGRLEGPAPLVSLFGGKLTLIRPLVFLTARELHRFARACDLPVYESTCPHRETSQRARVRAWLKEFRKVCPEIYVNVYRAAEKHGFQRGSPRAGWGRGEAVP